MQEKTIPFQKQACKYYVQGNGIPLLLVHGFCGESSIWHDMIAHFSASFKLIIPDLPGYGKSSIVSKEYVIEKFSVEHYADYLHQILVYENVNEVHIVGHSMGGYIALAFAELFPHKTKSLTLFHSICYADDETKIENRKKAIAFVKKYGNKIFVEELYATLFAPLFYAENKNKIKAISQKINDINPLAIIASCYAMIGRKDRSDILKNAKVPVLFILGSLDTAINYDNSLNMCALPNVAKVHILQNVGHMGMIEAPQQTAEMINNFIKLQY